MEGLGKIIPESQLKQMIASVDQDGEGSIDLEEFLLLMARDKANADPLKELQKIFALFDKDGSGSIDAGELGNALRAMGQMVVYVCMYIYTHVYICVYICVYI